MVVETRIRSVLDSCNGFSIALILPCFFRLKQKFFETPLFVCWSTYIIFQDCWSSSIFRSSLNLTKPYHNYLRLSHPHRIQHAWNHRSNTISNEPLTKRHSTTLHPQFEKKLIVITNQPDRSNQVHDIIREYKMWPPVIIDSPTYVKTNIVPNIRCEPSAEQAHGQAHIQPCVFKCGKYLYW